MEVNHDESLFATCKRIVVISGAGISVNAGIPDFHSQKRHASFAGHISQSDDDASQFYTTMREIYNRSYSSSAEPTEFHLLMNRLATKGRLLRHYTQNVDCLERLLPDLEKKTVRLHGQVNQARCTRCDWVGPIESFTLDPSGRGPSCQKICLERQISRIQQGKRHISGGILRPNILLYGENNPMENIIHQYSEKDLSASPDLVLIVGTQLKVPGAQALAMNFCKVAKKSGGINVWLNKYQNPKSEGVFQFVYREDCDQFAQYIS